jgi:hypothetical protein
MMERKPYTLAGRAIPEQASEGKEVAAAPCIFCGKLIEHVNDGGPGWILSAVVDGQARRYLYCDVPPCDKVHYDEIWRCGCVADYVENIGDQCGACWRRRADAVPVAAAMPVRAQASRYLLVIDGPLFRRQRELLVKIADLAHRGQPYSLAAGDETLWEGLVGLTDAVADQAHDRYGIDCLLEGSSHVPP